MIEKHALLESIFRTNLWTKPFVNNMFPYIKEDYLSLQPEEQNTLKERYLHHLNRYLSAFNKLT